MTRRSVLAAVTALCLLVPAFSQDVQEAEINSVAGRTVEFINYVGPHSVIESAADIRGIGVSLGRSVAAGATRTGESGRYLVIHAVDPSVPAGFDADILFLGEGARVDHVDNLRRIIAGYLEGAYGYSAKDADTLAKFITIYNAVYRGDLAYFNSKYKPVVTRELDAANAGLSVRWDEWAGRSRIVIPLGPRAGRGVIGSVDTTPITDKPVVESLGREEGQAAAIEDRRDVVDIKERDVAQEQAAIDAEKARIAAEEAAIAAERARLEAAAGTGTAGTAGAGTTEAGTAAGTGAEAGTEAGGAQEAALATSEAARAEEAALAAREEAVAEDKAEVAAREEAVAAKQEEIAADRDAIAADQKETIATEVAAAAAKEESGVTLFQLVDPNLPLSRLVRVDLASGDVLRKSELNTMRAATALDLGDAWVAVAGQSTALSGAVRLVRIEKGDFAKVTEGKDDVFADTTLWKFGSSVYAVVKKGELWAIGRFDPVTLELKASSEAVTRWTFLSETGGKLVAQDPKGGFLLLEPAALTTASRVAP